MRSTKTFFNVFVNNKKEMLSESDYMAEGGEAKLFRKQNTIFKIYHDQQKMIPETKIRELQQLQHPSIVIPTALVFDDKHQIVGFTMTKADAYEMCRLFNSIYLTDNNITNEQLVKLVENMQNVYQFIHSKQCLVVDGNEMNYLVAKKDVTIPYFIDTNAYQTKNFPANAFTPAFTDPHRTGFDQFTDWYSFGIVACKIFIGIHPYKGGHPNYGKKDMLKRMHDRVSIFNNQSTIPDAARDFNNIPSEYFKWFVAVFEEGKKLAPPAIGGLLNVVGVKKQLTQEVDGFIIEKIMKEASNIKRIYTFRGKIKPITKGDHESIIFAPKSETEIHLTIENDFLKPVDPTKVSMPMMKQDGFFIKDNRLYIIYNGKLTSIRGTEIGSKCVFSIGSQWNVPVQSSKIFDGVITAVLFGKNYVFIPTIKNNADICAITHIPELDGHKIIYARCEKNVCMLVTSFNNQYNRIILVFDNKFEKYLFKLEEDIDYPYINFTVLDKGLCVMMNENAELELFPADPAKNISKKVTGGNLTNDMILFTDGLNVMYYKKNEIFKISMK